MAGSQPQEASRIHSQLRGGHGWETPASVAACESIGSRAHANSSALLTSLQPIGIHELHAKAASGSCRWKHIGHVPVAVSSSGADRALERLLRCLCQLQAFLQLGHVRHGG